MSGKRDRLYGHGLLFEGRAAVLAPGRWSPSEHRWIEDCADGSRWGLPIRVGCEGVGVCRCGSQSGVLPSTASRKRWHRIHKDVIRRSMIERAGS